MQGISWHGEAHDTEASKKRRLEETEWVYIGPNVKSISCACKWQSI